MREGDLPVQSSLQPDPSRLAGADSGRLEERERKRERVKDGGKEGGDGSAIAVVGSFARTDPLYCCC